MNVLLFSKDPALFNEGAGRIGDARRRHAFYAARLRERHPGSEIRIVGYTTAREGYAVQEIAPGVRLYPTNSLWRGFYLLGALRRLWRVLADGWRPDVVSVQTPWEEGVLGLILARLLGARFVPQLHVDIFSEEWARAHPLNRWRRFVARPVLARGHRVRAVSEPLRARIIEQCGVPATRVTVAPVGVDFTPAPHRVTDRAAPVVLFVGRLTAQKNLNLWLAVASAVLRQVPSACFVVVGEGEDRIALQERARELGLEGRVTFRGAVGHAQLPAIYAEADVFLLTSDYEGFGRVVLEAQLAGVAVVSTICSGPEDLIEDQRTGILVRKGDADGLAAAVVRLLVDQSLRDAIGVQGQQSARARFGLGALTDRLISVWESA